MASFKSHPIFYSALIALGVVVLAEGAFTYERSTKAAKAAAALAKQRDELATLKGSNPFPNDESKTAIEADLRRTQIALDTMREELKGRGPAGEQLRAAKVPAEATDLFFDLATFVEKTREKATAANIKFKADERFGFTAYANAGPERELIPHVFRQRQVIQYLVEALIASNPKEINAIQRERPISKAELAESAQAASGEFTTPKTLKSVTSDPDLFEIDPRITARVPGFLNATSFRLVFNGDTESLRKLLNKLATFELPLVVRSVEVETAGQGSFGGNSIGSAPATDLNALFGLGASASSSGSAPEVEKPKPLVEKLFSKFTVTVELIDLVTATTPPASATEETPSVEATPTS
jgi:hypothetical protein